MEVETAFIEEGGKTRLNWRMRFPSVAERDRVDREYRAAAGLAQTLSRLDAHVRESNRRAFVILRSFNAPQAFLWKALTEPDRIAEWWRPKGSPVIAAKMDFRPGGAYLYGLKTPDCGAMWGRFVYHEINEPRRIVLVSSFSNEDGGVAHHPISATWPLETLSTYELESEGEGAKLTIRALPISSSGEERATFVNARDSMVGGWSGTFEQLADYLANR